MKPEYTIQFPDGPRTFKPRAPFISNRTRSEYAKIEGLENVMTDMNVLNQVLAVILDTSDDFSDAETLGTQEVFADFFSLLTPKTTE